MKHASRIFIAFFVSSAMIAGPAMAATPGGLARGPAKTYRSLGETSPVIPASGAAIGLNTDNGNTVVRYADKTATGMNLANIQAVKIINVNAMDAGNHSSANTVPTNTTALERQEIRAALQSSAYIIGRLRAQSVNLSQVIAANQNANKTITVYIR